VHLLLCQTEEKTDESESNKPQNFVTQTIPSWPKYLMAKSTDENIQLTKLNSLRLADSINYNQIQTSAFSVSA